MLVHAHLDSKRVVLTVRLQKSRSVVEECARGIVQWVASSRDRRSVVEDVPVVLAKGHLVRYDFLYNRSHPLTSRQGCGTGLAWEDLFRAERHFQTLAQA
jgi:hypothetical protein